MKKSLLPRRAFLKASAGAGIGALLAACNLPVRPAETPPGVPVLPTQTPAPTLPRASGNPDFAGMLVSTTEGAITLRAVRAERSVIVAPGIPILDEAGSAIPAEALGLYSNVAVWVGSDPLAATGLQRLPDLTAVNPLPMWITQPEPTGEIVPLGGLAMVTRTGWGAAAPDLTGYGEHGYFDAASNPEGWLEYPAPLADALNTIVVHHSALDFSDGPREIQALHRVERGYADIAYHYVIDSFGTLYEGRVITARGAHTGGSNTGTVGVVLLGNYSLIPVLRGPLATLTALCQYLAPTYTITHLAGNRDFQPNDTECPGENLEAILPDLAGSLGLVYGTGGYVAPPWTQ